MGKFLDESGVATLWELIKAEDAKGAKVVAGSYVGTGTYGEANKTSLTFGFVPKLLWVTTDRWLHSGNPSVDRTSLKDSFFVMNGASGVDVFATLIPNIFDGDAYFTWSGNTVSWYGYYNGMSDYIPMATPAIQMNTSGETYYYFAIG